MSSTQIIFIIAFLLCFLNVTLQQKRSIDISFNPGCDLIECTNQTAANSSINLLYLKATGSQDVIHTLYSTIGAFTILLFKTSLNATLNINWTELTSNDVSTMYQSINFSENPSESTGFVIPTIYEFNDTNGQADMTKVPNNSSFQIVHNTSSLDWQYVNATAPSIGSFVGKVKGVNGTFKFVLRYYGQEKRDNSLPHLLVSPETTSIDFVIDSYQSIFNYTKFGISIVTASNLNGISLNNKKSLDDEYTPGTFQQWTIETYDNTTNDMKIHSFLQWKPVFYFYNKLTLENSTETKQYSLVQNQELPWSLASAYFDSTQSRYASYNLSFGLEDTLKDGYFYPQTNYSSWSFMVGIGEPAPEKMSTVVTMVIFVGFGLPALIIFVGLLAVLIRRCRQGAKSGYEEL